MARVYVLEMNSAIWHMCTCTRDELCYMAHVYVLEMNSAILACEYVLETNSAIWHMCMY